MEQHTPIGHQIELMFRLSELRPEEASIAIYRTRLAEVDPNSRVHYCLGWLMANVEGIAQGIGHGDAAEVVRSLRLGLAIIAVYEQAVTLTEERLSHNVDDKTTM
jgi:hypothetical protein